MTVTTSRVRGANCFNTQFQAHASGHSTVNAYLLMRVSRLIFPDQLGVSWTDQFGFWQTFERQFKPLGIHKFTPLGNHSLTRRYGTDGVVMSNDNIIIVAFRGTEISAGWDNLLRDWLLTNVNITQTAVPSFGRGAKVHTGMWRAFSECRDSLIQAVNNHCTAGQKVWVTGHSLGGAQATLAAKTLELSNIPVQGLYTFASPRVGNEAFVKAFDRMNVQRYVYALDLVPMMPDDLALGYRHVGRTNNLRIPFLPNAGPYDSSLQLNSREVRGIGTAADHHVQRYEAALFHALRVRPNKQGVVPSPRCSTNRCPV
jgi:pimeloyl-ACP methyl ester carboxylesterase